MKNTTFCAVAAFVLAIGPALAANVSVTRRLCRSEDGRCLYRSLCGQWRGEPVGKEAILAWRVRRSLAGRGAGRTQRCRRREGECHPW